jgi:hypothetical protein
VESRLVSPVDDPAVYVELSLRDLWLKWFHYYGILPGVARRLRDQLSAHLDAVEVGDDLAPGENSLGAQNCSPVNDAGISAQTPDESANGAVERSLPGGVFHLISAHEVVPNGGLSPTYFAAVFNCSATVCAMVFSTIVEAFGAS